MIDVPPRHIAFHWIASAHVSLVYVFGGFRRAHTQTVPGQRAAKRDLRKYEADLAEFFCGNARWARGAKGVG